MACCSSSLARSWRKNVGTRCDGRLVRSWRKSVVVRLCDSSHLRDCLPSIPSPLARVASVRNRKTGLDSASAAEYTLWRYYDKIYYLQTHESVEGMVEVHPRIHSIPRESEVGRNDLVEQACKP
jgi:hypothetical protein